MKSYKYYNWKKMTALTACLSLGWQLLQAQASLSFTDAQQLMLGNNIEVRINDKKVATETINEQTAKALRYPHFNAFGMASVMNKDIKYDLNDKREQVGQLLQLPDPSILGNWAFTLQKKDIEFAGVGMSWPIYTGGKIQAAQNAARITTSIAKNDKYSSEQALISELADRYYKAKLAEEAVHVRQQVLDGMNQHLSDALKLEKNGIIAGAEVLQAKVAVADAQTQLLAAKKDLQLSETALANTLEVDSADYELTSPFFIKSDLHPLSEYKEMAAANYPQIEKLRLMEKLAEQGIKAEKANYLPTVALTGQKIVASNNFPLVKNPLVVGVGVNYDLFDGFARKNKIRAAQNQQQTVVLAREKAEMDIRTLVEKLYNELKKSEEQITSFKVSESLAEELVRVRRASFAEGMASSTNVIDAELNLHAIRLQSLKTYSDYDATLAKLYELCGISNDFVNAIH